MSPPQKTIEDKLEYLTEVLHMVQTELKQAWKKHPGEFHNAHEGFAVLAEEVDELWDEVKANTAYDRSGMKEAIQIAAMAVRFVVELHDHPKADPASRLVLAWPETGSSQATSPRTHLGRLGRASGGGL